MVGIGDVAATATVLSQARGFLKALQDGKLSSAHEALVAQAMEVVSDATERLFTIQTALLELQQENAALQSQLETAANWSNRIAAYELVQAEGGAIVYRSKSGLKHYACPRCVEADRQLQVLQTLGTLSGDYQCPGCDQTYSVDKPERSDIYSGFR